MQKVARHFSAIAGRILFIGFSMQILLGLVWMCCNIGCPEGSNVYAQLLQLMLAFFAGCFCVKTIAQPKKIMGVVWGSLALLTVPMSLQCHLMSGKESLIGSFLVCQLAFLWRGVKRSGRGEMVQEETDVKGYRALASVGVFWVLEAIVAPEYKYLGAVPMLLFLGYDLYVLNKVGRKDVKAFFYRLLLVCAFGGMIFGVNNLRQEEADGKSIRYEVASALFKRCAWTTVVRDGDTWSAELMDVAGGELIWSSSYYADNLEKEFMPVVLEKLGEDGAAALYFDVVKDAVSLFPGRILKEMIWDAFAYTVPPIGTHLFLEGRGYDSYTPRNYDLMRQEAPRLTKYYMDYSCKWFGVALIIAALSQLLSWVELVCARQVAEREGTREQGCKIGRGRKCLTDKYAVVSMIVTVAFIVIWYTLRGAGMMDYRQVSVICSLWTVWMIKTSDAAFKSEK